MIRLMKYVKLTEFQLAELDKLAHLRLCLRHEGNAELEDEHKLLMRN